MTQYTAGSHDLGLTFLGLVLMTANDNVHEPTSMLTLSISCPI